MKKTVSYRMEVNVLDTLEVSVELNAGQFEKKANSLHRQWLENKDVEEDTFKIDYNDKIEEFEQYIRRTIRASIGGTDIELIKVKCKPGFCFEGGK